MHSLARQAYGQVQHRTAGPKEIEHAVFEQITEALQDVAKTEAPVPNVYADAVSRNMELWTILAADLMSDANALPLETKQGLLGLSEFVRRTSMTLLTEGGDVTDLIDVNIAIMRGLRGDASVAA
ncbi:flagellar biosynthesis regulator FlaF [Hyphomonas sp. FCG-A18]|uniref:flagellar biosynthesis regulator FlaF n=1 Tax=Hyphomonas sp. FCG-A18 TaxID=3080019 RepID=UPI002B31511F|nr:flagellar biosynthesis regulator FlaF [Hyphomonas sp. FCG-A18]